MHDKRCFLVAAAVLSFFASYMSLAAPSPQTRTFVSASARGISQPGLPVQVSEIGIVPDSVADETTLSFEVTNNSEKALTQLDTFLLWLSPDKTTRGGQSN